MPMLNKTTNPLKPNTDYCKMHDLAFPRKHSSSVLATGPQNTSQTVKQRSFWVFFMIKCHELQRGVSKRKNIGLVVCDFTNDTNPVVYMTEVMMPVR